MDKYKNLVFEKYSIPDEQIIKSISKAKCENRANRGSIVFIKKCDFDKISQKVEFDVDMQLYLNEGGEAERKLFESCTLGYHMAVEVYGDKKYKIIGFVKDSEEIRRDYALIMFEGEGRYSVTLGGNEVLICEIVREGRDLIRQ